MRLKKIELQGFKSFADKTEIVFDDGITAVVGPNGSGKSNISDALRWVLGEQSAKTLRGSKMGDVIFAGTQSRKPMGFCQVSLYFDNEDKWLNIDFTEVVITRKYYKSGESEYYINRNACRLKDVLELFRDTGVGKDGYSIIGQGQITNIVSSNSNDRRTAFETATGIIKYKTRKAEAQNRLEKTAENILRLNDIISEVSVSLDNLKIQSAKAKDYIQKRDRLKELDINVFANKTLASNEKINKSKNELRLIEDAITRNGFDMENAAKTRANIENSQNEKNGILASLKQEYANFRENVVKNNSDKTLLEQKLVSLNSNIENEQSTISVLEKEIENNKQSVLDIDKEIKERKEKLSDVKNQYEKAVAENEESKKELQNKQQELDKLKQQKIAYLNSVSNIKVNISRYKAMVESIDERLDNIKVQSGNIEKNIELLDKELFETLEENTKLDNSICEEKKALEDLHEVKNNIKEEIALSNEKINDKKVKLEGIKSGYELLYNMQKEYEGFNGSVKNLLKYCDENKLNDLIHGTVADIVKVDKEYTVAIENCLGGNLQNIVTEDEEVTKQLIQILKDNSLGRVTFLPLTTVKEQYLEEDELERISKIDGVIGTADSLVSYEEKYDVVIKKLLGRVVVAKNIDCALKVMKKNHYKFMTVTLEGEVIHPGGAISGGSKVKKQVGLLSRNEKIARLKNEIEIAEQDIDALELEIKNKKNDKEKTQAKIIEQEEKINAIELKQEEIKNILNTIKVQKDAENKVLNELKIEQEQLADNKNDIMKKLSLIDEEKQNDVETASDEEIEKISNAVSALNELIESQYEKTTALAVGKNDIEKDIVVLEKDTERIKKENEKHIQKISNTKNVIKKLESEKEGISKQLKDNSKLINKVEKEEENFKKKIDSITKEIEALSVKRKDNDNNVERLRKETETNTHRKYQLQSEIDKLQVELNILSREIFEKYNMTFEEIDYNKIEKISGATREIAEIKQQITALGNVNLNAIDEYATTNARYTELSIQMEDLVASKKDLEDLIDMLYKNMTAQFKEQFALINENFKRIFVNLFGGGHAELVLKDTSNVMESEIDVVAQPPGKKLQTISLLSGGEKALTAIAILFAMLELKATPFCVLDEIEAALDEANVYNFANYLMNYSNKTQFIVITHRRGVMDNCDAIYGVAMQEKGISKVVSIKLNKGE